MNLDKKHKLPRRPTSPPLNEHEQLLFEYLELIFEENVQSSDFGRQAAFEAVQVVRLFLNKRGLAGQAMNPLIKVEEAFDDLKRGVLPELFDPASTKNAGLDGNRKWSRSRGAAETKIYAVAAMGALMKQGVKKIEAANRTATAVQSWSTLSAGIIKPMTIVNWRDYLMQSPKTDVDRQRFELLITHLTSGPRTKEFLLEVLHNGPPTGGPRRKKTDSKT
jgi:hypothetical protein